MALRGPVVTAVAVLAGLAGLVTVNSAGGQAVGGVAAPSPLAAEQTEPASPPPTSPAPAGVPPAAEPAPEPAPAFPAEVVYAGRASTGRLAIAVAVKGEQAVAYLCDGLRVEAWLSGTAAQGKVELSAKDGSTRLTATLDGGNLTGVATVGGQRHPFTIGVAGPPAGLYRGADGSTTISWIVLPDGTQVGIARTGNGPAPAPKLDPRVGSVTVDGRRIEAGVVAGVGSFG